MLFSFLSLDMEAKIDALIREVSSLTEQTKQLKQENIEIRAQLAEIKSRINQETDEEDDDHQESSGFLCFKSSGQIKKRNLAPPGRTTHGNASNDDHDLSAPGSTTHPSRGNRKPLPVFKPKNTPSEVTSSSNPEYSQV